MFTIKMMTSRVEGYKVAGYADTVEQAREKVNGLKVYYNPIDVYYTVSK